MDKKDSKTLKDCCTSPKIEDLDSLVATSTEQKDGPDETKTITFKLPVSKKAVAIVVLSLLAGLTVVQTLQIAQLRSQFDSGLVPAAQAAGGASAPAATNNLEALPDMVGGC